MSRADTTRRLLLTGVVGLIALRWARASGEGRADLWIASDGDELKFVPDRLECTERERIRLHFHHGGRISSDPHDWVLLRPGTAQAFLHDADQQAEDRVIPPGLAADVIAATKLCARGQNVTVDFTAPPAGTYPFVCSVAGHGGTMRGTLVVRSRLRR